MPDATTISNAPPEHWQITLVAGTIAGVVLIALVFFIALGIALRRDARDQARADLTKLVDELTTEARSYLVAHDDLRTRDHQASVSAWVRWHMASDAADRIRTVLEHL